jgi:hypothetical protein
MKTARLLLIAAFLLIHVSCGQPEEGWILNFEDEEQLAHLIWACPTDMERTPSISGAGKYALKAHLLPGVYPGVEIWKMPRNWTGYDALEFYVNAPEAAGETLHIRIDDRETNEEFESRYQGYRKLEGGSQRIVIPIDEIRNGPAGRKLDMRRIHRMVVYLYNQERRVTLTIDDFRLIREKKGATK